MAVETPDAALPGVAVATYFDAPPSRLGQLRASIDLLAPAAVFSFIVLACFLWPLVYPLPSPTAGNLLYINAFPLTHHSLVGTDPIGVDILSRLLYGGRVSLEVGIGATATGMAIGGFFGALAGYRGGAIESVTMRVLDTLLAFPPLVLAIVIATYLGPSELHVIWAIAFFSIPAFARLARAQTLRLREQNFVFASQLSGSRDWRILVRHIAPNIVPQLLTFALLGVGIAIMVEAALSFLGLGVPAGKPSWGNMISLGEQYLASDPYLVLIPSALLFITVMSINLLGDAIRARWSA